MTATSLATDAWFLSGPTASGKSAVGLELARRNNAEIVSLDSMAVYRGMDIGTAKPTAEELAVLPHHLVDLVDPSEEFSVAQYVAAAQGVAAEIAARGRQVLFVGGTPLYLKSLLRGLFEGPAADWPLRHELAELARRDGSQALHARLAEVDPVAATRLHPNDARRLIRALEVFHRTGRPISSLQTQFEIAKRAEECHVFVLDWPRDVLGARIDRRVDQMFDAGLVNEVRGLLAQHGQLGRTAAQAVGYREVLEHLAGQRDLRDTIALTKTRTRQFAKRQLTWLRSLSECRWIAMAEPLQSATVAHRIATTVS